MRTSRFRVLLLFVLVLIAMGGLFWFEWNREGHLAHQDTGPIDQGESLQAPTRPDRIVVSPQKLNAPVVQSIDFCDAIVRYESAEDFPTKWAIVNEVTSTQTNFWQLCAWRIWIADEIQLDKDTASTIAHFASAYYKKGPKQKEELLSLLRSNDSQLIAGLLCLLGETHDLGPNGENQWDKRLSAGEILPYVSQIARVHPELAISVVGTLEAYGEAAKSESATLLRIILSRNESASTMGRLALIQVDNDLYSRFGLDRDGPLTERQQEDIESYLASIAKTLVNGRFRCFSIMVVLPNFGSIASLIPAQTKCKSLYDYMVRFRAARDSAARAAIANAVASSQSNLWESCAWRIWLSNQADTDALAYFASAYFKRGSRQKEELISLLHSRDLQLLVGLLRLLEVMRELGPNGEWQADKPLVGSEIPQHPKKPLTDEQIESIMRYLLRVA